MVLDLQAVLFDLDGVLVDSIDLIGSCADLAFRDGGLAGLTGAERRSLVGPPLRVGMADVLRARGDDASRAEALVQRYRALYDPIAASETPAHAGMPALVERLAAALPLAVVTSKAELLALAILDHLGLLPYFVEVVGAPVGGDEAKTGAVARALLALAVDGSRAAIVGDRLHDVEAGGAHGLVTIGVTWGAGDRAELEEAGADHVVDTVPELATILGVAGEALAG